VGWDDVVTGLNQALGVADQDVADLLRAAGAGANELENALKSALGWTDQQLSNFLESAGGKVSTGAQNVSDFVSGKRSTPWGIPEGSLVFFDADKNATLAPGEPWGFTSSEGGISFEVPSTFDTDHNGSLNDAEGQWVLEGGTDLATGLPVLG